ncbi:hypothetical protein E1B28_013685 [Marasmius oreades]|uniref:HD domain-containing protein n=1 Tax=Marasmius oreades TaxID=181124 RepID=A0A9P7RQA5_9AGAR|nr:uncharacterized protein E1B28_013685 [Marasmius oreades]KAG7087744.1 hypothetical protein E1B28_013685 [Marasmius oreades]
MSSTNTDPNVAFYGFSPVARDPDVLFDGHPTASGDNPKQDLFTIENFPLPDSSLVRDVKAFVKNELDEQTFNHSNRVYVYGVALTKTHFPHWSYDYETYYLACLLHDIGTAEKYLATTKMSFEFKGAIVARELIFSLGGVEDQADSVCDAIVRHQDIFVKGGNITMIGQILQLSTVLGMSIVSIPRLTLDHASSSRQHGMSSQPHSPTTDRDNNNSVPKERLVWALCPRY